MASLELTLDADSFITWHIFTDQVATVNRMKLNSKKIEIISHEIPPLGWPEATMLRYELFTNFQESIQGDVLVYMDADMLVHRSFQKDIELAMKSDQIALVAHPGYWRPAGLERLKLYLGHPKMLLRDILMKIRLGGLGSWETRLAYSAFVPRRKRRDYVCGGIWLGPREKFLALCKTLARESAKEANDGRIPIWHDESYLNKWAIENRYLLISSKLCFDPLYPQLSSIEKVVEAVRKINNAK